MQNKQNYINEKKMNGHIYQPGRGHKTNVSISLIEEFTENKTKKPWNKRGLTNLAK
jgi:hypothetical protein